MSTAMTGQDIIDRFETLIDDQLDSDQSLFLLNAAKDEVEAGRDWNFNRGYDASKSVAANDNYLSMKALPTDFLSPRKIYANNEINPHILISFEDRERYKDVYKRWYIDYVNSQFAICGSQGIASTIKMFYSRSSPTVTLTTSPVWPAAFHPYLVFKMAEMWQSGSDGDEVNFRMSPANLRIANSIFKQFCAWDARLKVAEYNAKNTVGVELSSYPNVVGGDFTP